MLVVTVVSACGPARLPVPTSTPVLLAATRPPIQPTATPIPPTATRMAAASTAMHTPVPIATLTPTPQRTLVAETAEAYFQRGVANFNLSDLDRAIADFDKAIALNPNLAEAYYNRGTAYGRKGDLEQAIADLDKAIALKPDLAEAYNNRGIAYNNKGQFDRAIADYDKAIALKPDYAEPYYNRGNAYYYKGDFDRAIADYNKAIALKPDYAEPYYSRGNAYHHKGDFDRAIADYNKAIALKPDLAEAYNDRGIAYGNKGQFDRAIADYDKAIALKPDYAEAYYYRGNAYADKGDLDRAISDWTRAIALRPDDVKAYYKRGLAYKQKGEKDKAIADFRKVLELSRDPTQRQQAEEQLRILGVTPREPLLVEERGWIEIMFTGVVNLETPDSTQLGQTLLFHGPGSKGEGFDCTGCYVLELLPDAQIKVPSEDRQAGGITILQGKDHEYLVKGTISSKRLESIFLSHVPVLQVIYFERLADVPATEPLPTPTSGPTSTPIPALTLIPEGVVPLAEALTQGLVEGQMRGTGAASGNSITLALRRLVPRTLQVTLNPGTVLVSSTGSEQNMIVRQLLGLRADEERYWPAEVITLDTAEQRLYSVEAYCLDFHKDNPVSTTAFSLGGPPSPEVLAVLEAVDRTPGAAEDIVAIQSALWVAIEDVTWAELAERGYEPDQGMVRAILQAASIDIGCKQFFGGKCIPTPSAPTRWPTALSTLTETPVLSTSGVSMPMPTATGPRPTSTLAPTRTPVPIQAAVASPVPPRQAPHPAGCPHPNVQITGPADDQVWRGTVNVFGIATHPEFQRYEVKFRSPAVPDQEDRWRNLTTVRQPVPNQGFLMYWNTTTVPNGTYLLKLRVVRRDGNYEDCTITAHVQN
jgi:tetratricopeptide (TPR) repeat protein